MVTDAVEKACVPFEILSNRLIQVKVAIHRIGVDGLIDTGASMSFIHVNLWHHIDELNEGRIHLQPSFATTSQSSTGDRQQILGWFKSDFHIGKICTSTTFFVVDRQPVGLLLGAEWLIDYRVIINYPQRSLTLRRPGSDLDDKSAPGADAVQPSASAHNQLCTATHFTHCPEMIMKAYTAAHLELIDALAAKRDFPESLCKIDFEFAELAQFASRLVSRFGLLFSSNSHGDAHPYVP